MKLQDENPYNSTLLGLDELYTPIGIDKFYINSPFVEANFNTITTGETYVVIHAESDSVLTLKIVNLIDVYYDGFMMNIFLHDMVSEKQIHLEFDIYRQEDKCPFKLVELDHLKKKMDFLVDNSWEYC